MKEKDKLIEVRYINGMEYKPVYGTLKKDEEIIRLTWQEDIVLELLCDNRGEIVSRQDIFFALRQKDDNFSSTDSKEAIRENIAGLRRKLGKYSIRTFYTRGYSLR